MQCPRCQGELKGGDGRASAAHGCGRCGGVWLDNAATARLRDNLGPEIVAFAARVDALAQPSGGANPFGLRCPWCATSLVRVHDPDAGTELDACVTHGTWFDRGEVQQVAEAVSRSVGVGQARPVMMPSYPMEAPVPADYIPPVMRVTTGKKVAIVIGGIVGALLTIGFTILYVVLRLSH